MPLIVTIALLLSVSAYAQSDETCIAYMEADAAYKAVVYRDEEVVKSSWAYISASNAWAEAVGKAKRRSDSQREAYNLDEARRLLREVEEALEKSINSMEAVSKARKTYEKSLAVARAKFDPARDAAYRAAYGGPTSDVEIVMNKLIAADRERCRFRLELHPSSPERRIPKDD